MPEPKEEEASEKINEESVELPQGEIKCSGACSAADLPGDDSKDVVFDTTDKTGALEVETEVSLAARPSLIFLS